MTDLVSPNLYILFIVFYVHKQVDFAPPLTMSGRSNRLAI